MRDNKERVQDILTCLERGYCHLQNDDHFEVESDLNGIWTDLCHLLPDLGFYAWVRKIGQNVWAQCFPSIEEAEKGLQTDIKQICDRYKLKVDTHGSFVIASEFETFTHEIRVTKKSEWRRLYDKGE